MTITLEKNGIYKSWQSKTSFFFACQAKQRILANSNIRKGERRIWNFEVDR